MNYRADMISRIRIAIIKRTTFVRIKNTKDCARILTKLHIDGYIQQLIIEGDFIKIFFNFKNNMISIRDIQLLSKPGFKRYISAQSLHSLHNYDQDIYLMTNIGILNKIEAKAKNIGGIGILTIR